MEPVLDGYKNNVCLIQVFRFLGSPGAGEGVRQWKM
jgi:hypothetical protein